MKPEEIKKIHRRQYEKLRNVKIVYMGVVGDTNKRLPYGAKGRIKRHGLERSLIDFGKAGIWRVPNIWLHTEKPDIETGKTMAEALGILKEIAPKLGLMP